MLSKTLYGENRDRGKFREWKISEVILRGTYQARLLTLAREWDRLYISLRSKSDFAADLCF